MDVEGAKMKSGQTGSGLGEVREMAQRLITQAQGRVGTKDGMDYEVRDVLPGRGMSYRELAVKEMPNGRSVCRFTQYPGPLDGLAGLSTTIEESFRVWVGWERYDEVLAEIAPIALPEGAVDLINPDLCDHSIWFAVFDDQEKAEAYASQLGPAEDNPAELVRTVVA